MPRGHFEVEIRERGTRMTHDHGHGPHEHPHPHAHQHEHDEGPLAPELDASIDDGDLSPTQLGRRSFLRAAGLLGAGATVSVLSAANAGQAAAAPVTASGSGRVPRGGFNWLAGDHHIHTQYSPDGQYRVIDHVRHANAYGLDWMVITDHGSVQHAKIGVEKVNPDIVAARGDIKDTLIFQGLEWNIPAAEHGTVFVHPGTNEVSVLKQFENSYDGVVAGATANTPANEALAIDRPALPGRRRAQAGRAGRADAGQPPGTQGHRLPARDPRLARRRTVASRSAWRARPATRPPASRSRSDRAPGRGFYDNSPDPAASFAGYPLESYRTFGGFDWMTATVGGLWDSLLAEGKPWWITANSDSHQIWADTSQRGPDSDFTTNGFFNDPVHITAPQLDPRATSGPASTAALTSVRKDSPTPP